MANATILSWLNRPGVLRQISWRGSWTINRVRLQAKTSIRERPFYNLSRDPIDEVGSFRSLLPTGFDVELPHVGLAVAQVDQGQSHAAPRLRLRFDNLEELSTDALPARGFANEQFGNISFRSLQEKIRQPVNGAVAHDLAVRRLSDKR